jgi:hypothetical protein
MNRLSTLAAIGLAAALLPVGASALGISVQTFPGGTSALGAARAAYNAELAKFDLFAAEGFETLNTLSDGGGVATLGQISGSLTTAVGVFTTTGGNGTGTSAVGDTNLNSEITTTTKSTNIALRNDTDGQNDGGRFNTTLGGGNYLDSNDTNGFKWTIDTGVTPGLAAFDRLLFTLVDVADQRKTLTIRALDEDDNEFFLPTTISGQQNATINTVLISFNTRVTFAEIQLDKGSANDGFSGDDFVVGAVPLPAAAWMLMSAAVGLFVAKRRTARAA